MEQKHPSALACMPEKQGQPAPSSRLIRRPEVQSMTGLGRSSIYDALAAGTFPDPVKLSTRSVAWRESEVLAWIDSRQSARTPKAA